MIGSISGNLRDFRNALGPIFKMIPRGRALSLSSCGQKSLFWKLINPFASVLVWADRSNKPKYFSFLKWCQNMKLSTNQYKALMARQLDSAIRGLNQVTTGSFKILHNLHLIKTAVNDFYTTMKIIWSFFSFRNNG